MQQPSVSSAISSSYQDSATDDSLSVSVDQDRTSFEQRLHGVEQTIDRLYRLSVAIRRPSIISQNAKAANFVLRDEYGNDVGEQFAEFALRWISHQFPDAAPELCRRLANSVTLRRKRFLYRQSHQMKLSTKAYSTHPAPLTERSTAAAQNAESTVVARTIVKNQGQIPHNKHSKTFKSNMPSQTSASKVSRKIRTQDIFGMAPLKPPTECSSVFPQQADISIPDPPKPPPGSKEFECPYCCMMLPIKDTIASNWR